MVTLLSYSQNVPQGMNYQAVARDKAGHELVDKQISLKISLYSPSAKGTYYSETHSVVTNQFGLFSLIIGQGTIESGAFTNVPWSKEDIWIDVAIQNEGENDFTPIGSSKLYTVPYAFYAGTAGGVTNPVGGKKDLAAGQCPCNGGITKLTFLYLGPNGVTINVYNDPHLQPNQFLGTFTGVNSGAVLTLNAPIIPPPPPGLPVSGPLKDQTFFQYSGIANPPAVQAVPTKCGGYDDDNPASPGGTFGNISIISQTDKSNATCTACNVSGLWYIGGNAVMDACNTLGTLTNTDLTLITNNTPRLVITKSGDINISNNLNVGADLHVAKNAFLNESGGSTTNDGPFMVANGNPTHLTGTLTADNAALLNNSLTVVGNTNLNGYLNVNNLQPTNLTGTLTVGKATQLNSTLGVAGNSDLYGYLHVNNVAPTVLSGTLEGYQNATFDQHVIVSNASLNSTSPSTGGLVVQGGTGIGQTLYVGGPTFLLSTLNVGGNTDLFGYLHVDNNSPTLLTGTLEVDQNATFLQHVTLTNAGLNSSDSSNGALVVAGGVGIGKNLNVGGSATFSGPVSFKSVVTITNQTQSTDYTNGSLVTYGGVGVAKNLNVNGAVGFNNTLNVLGATTLQSTLGVTGNTDLGGYLHVNNFQPTSLTGSLTVTGATLLNNTLGVMGNTDLGGYLNVNNNQPTNLSGTLTVGQATQLNSSLTVSGPTTLNSTLSANGRVVINANEDAGGDHSAAGAYPLVVEGSKQGIRIAVTGNSSGTPDRTNDFLQFVDAGGTVRGSVTGETIADLTNDAAYVSQEAFLSANLGIVTAQTAEAVGQQIACDASVTGCEGLGICVTDPIPSLIVSSAFNLGVAIANEAVAAASLASYTAQYQANIGVVFNSGSGDYAEWLPKSDANEKISRGDIVGVKGGFISKSTEGAEKLMVISTMPIVLGNTPPAGKESGYEKVAFIGQIHVKVYGKVNPGDYILSTEGATGFGAAKHPEDMTAADYRKIVGIAWEGSNVAGVNYVNTAVGINNNDLARLADQQEAKIKTQANEINDLKKQMNETNQALAKLVPGFSAAIPVATTAQNTLPAVAAVATQGDKPEYNAIHYREISRPELEEGLRLAVETLQKSGQTAKNNIFLKKLTEDPSYKEQFFAQIQESVKRQIEKNKEIDRKFGR